MNSNAVINIEEEDGDFKDMEIVQPAARLSRPEAPSNGASFPNQCFLRPVNIDIVITPCDNILQNPYEHSTLVTKFVTPHKRSLARKHYERLNWLSAPVNETRLRNAASNKDGTEVRGIISKDPNINLNCADEKQRTALHISAANGAEEVVRELLANGASPNVKDANGNTPLHLAACSGKVPIVTLLLHHGADISATDFNGKTPLHLALARLRVYHNSKSINEPGYDHLKRRAQIKDIADLLREYLHREGTQKEKEDISMLTCKISNLSSEREVDEIGSLLLNFTQMAIDSKKDGNG